MKIVYLAISVFLFVLFCPNETKAQSEKKTVAVLEFNSSSHQISRDEVVALSKRFRSALAKTDSFNISEWTTVIDILNKNNVNISGDCISDECMTQIGQLLSVDLVVYGKIERIGQTYTIDARMIDVTLGIIRKAETRDFSGNPDLLPFFVTEVANSLAGIKRNESYIPPALPTRKSTSNNPNRFLTEQILKKLYVGISCGRSYAIKYLGQPATDYANTYEGGVTSSGNNLGLSVGYSFTKHFRGGIRLVRTRFSNSIPQYEEKLSLQITNRIAYAQLMQPFRYLNLNTFAGLGISNYESKISRPLHGQQFKSANKCFVYEFGVGTNIRIFRQLLLDCSLSNTTIFSKGTDSLPTTNGSAHSGFDSKYVQMNIGIMYDFSIPIPQNTKL